MAADDQKRSRDLRKEAAEAVRQILEEEGYASLVIDKTLKKLDNEAGEPVPERDRRFFTSLVYTTVKQRDAIDGILKECSEVPLNKMKPMVRSCLRIGTAQLLFMDGIKPYAAVSETVNVIRRSKLKGLSGFVNGVLRSVQRNGASIKLDASSPCPEWILDSIEKDYGKQRRDQFARVLPSVRPLCIRIDAKEEAGMAEALKEFPNYRQGNLVGRSYYLEHAGDIGSSEAYRKGFITVQDESSQLAAMLVGAMPGEKVLDLCAAPGGKTTFMAEEMKNEGMVDSRDVHSHRVELIRQNAERLGLSCVTASVSDGTLAKEEDREAFDRVLLDAPCSGLGILRSKPDIALNHSEEDRKQLEYLQQRLLETAALAVKPGGRLVYSTCTLVKEENENRVMSFLSKHPEFMLLNIGAGEAGMLKAENFTEEEANVSKTLTLWPIEKGHDGFFVSVMMKKAEKN